MYSIIGRAGGKAKGKPKGFAALKLKDPEKFKELSSKGGKKKESNRGKN